MLARTRPFLIVAVVAVVASVFPTASVSAEDSAAASAIAPYRDWTHTMSNRAVSTSSPVLVHNEGAPFVVAGDTGGNLRAFDLETGAPRPGWGNVNTGFVTRAPLSSDGTNVYLPVAQDGKNRYPLFHKYAPDGTRLWASNTSTVFPDTPTKGFMLAGFTLARVGNQWRGFAGSSGHWLYGVNTDTGAQLWRLLNADSTMATPVAVDVYGTGRPQMITSNTTSKEFPWDRHGGIFRVLTDDGRQVCTATQLVDGDIYAHSGYNLSTPAVAEIEGEPLIVFGSTGPTQTGTGANQLVAYDQACRLRWVSQAFDERAEPSPTFADVTGNGRLEIVMVTGAANGTSRYPRVYILDPVTGAVIGDTGTALAQYGALLAYPPSMAITTLDANNDGAQDLIVPARQGQFLILSGATLEVLATIPTNHASQNTPIVTQTANGVRITFGGYSSAGAVVSSYIVPGATLGSNGWRMFGNNPQLTGTQGAFSGPYRDMLEGSMLQPGQALRTRAGAQLRMQHDGNLVATDSASRVRWHTGTNNNPGAHARFDAGGVLTVRARSGAVLWSSKIPGPGVERLTISDNGVVHIHSATWAETRQLVTQRLLWDSNRGALWKDRIVRGEVLAPGESLTSKDGSSRVTMQRDGNLVATRNGRVRWSSGTRDTSGTARLVKQHDGNLVIYSGNGRVVQNFGIDNQGGVLFVATNSGDVQVSNRNGGAVWRNGAVVK